MPVPRLPDELFAARPLRERLGALRRRRRVRQADIAGHLGISQAAYSAWERGADDVFLARTVAIVEAMGGRVEMHAVFDDVVRDRPVVRVYSLRRSRWPANFLERLEVAQRRNMPQLRWYDPHEEDAPRTDYGRAEL